MARKRRGAAVGLNLLRLHFCVYGYMGILAGVAAVVQAQITQSVAPNSLLGFELTVLAAVVLGGTSMSGGRGSLTGTPARRGAAGLPAKRADAAQRLGLLAPGIQRRDHFDQHQHHRLERKTQAAQGDLT
ncbi:hypothetical protein ABMB44_12555 [Levilactobacillus brevis]